MTLNDWTEITRAMNERDHVLQILVNGFASQAKGGVRAQSEPTPPIKFRALPPLGRVRGVRMGEDHANGLPDAPLAQLIEPSGRRSIIVRVGFAQFWCARNPEWSFQAL
jgi:hypothetical protein